MHNFLANKISEQNRTTDKCIQKLYIVFFLVSVFLLSLASIFAIKYKNYFVHKKTLKLFGDELMINILQPKRFNYMQVLCKGGWWITEIQQNYNATGQVKPLTLN